MPTGPGRASLARLLHITGRLRRPEPGDPFPCRGFLEKTDDPPTDQINAGCYVFRRSVLESIPTGRPVSVERETFPGLLEAGLQVFGFIDSSYWLNIGTPAAFVRGLADLVSGIAPTCALNPDDVRQSRPGKPLRAGCGLC